MYMTVKPEPGDYFNRDFIKQCGPERYEELRQYFRGWGYRVSDNYGSYNFDEDKDKRYFLRLLNDGDLVWSYGVNLDDRCLDFLVDFDEPPVDSIELKALQAIHSVTNNILTDSTVKAIYQAVMSTITSNQLTKKLNQAIDLAEHANQNTLDLVGLYEFRYPRTADQFRTFVTNIEKALSELKGEWPMTLVSTYRNSAWSTITHIDKIKSPWLVLKSSWHH